MIKSIRIVNFQSHKDTQLTFGELTNVIIGNNDVGKTSVIRAIEWAVNNRPSGDDFISDFKGRDEDVYVQLDFGEASVTRGRDKKGNYYKIKRPGEKDEWFRAFKLAVPEEVQKIVNLSNVNIQDQHDQHFLISAGASRAAKYLNRIINLESIDKGISNLNKWKREAAQEQRSLKELLSEEEGKLERFVELEKIDPKISVLEKLSGEILRLDRSMEKIHECISWIKHTDEKLGQFAGLKKVQSKFDALWQLEQKREREEVDYQKLHSLVKRIKNTDAEIKSTAQEIVSLQEEYDELMPEECPLCGASTITKRRIP